MRTKNEELESKTVVDESKTSSSSSSSSPSPSSSPSSTTSDITISSITTTLSVILWFSSNIGLLLTNKCLLSLYEFHYPIFITTLHMSACFVFSLGVRVALVSKNNNDHTSRDTIGDHQTIRDIRHLLKIALLSVVFVLSVVSGNISLRYIPVSFNQAISATTPLFTAILSYVILHKRETIETYIMLIPVTAGVVIASENEPMFNSYGFVACITATFMRALKSVLQGLILADEKDKLDPFSLLLFMSPIAFTILVLACSMMESNAFEVMSAKMMMSSSTKIVSFEVTLFLNCILAFLVNLSNFMVTKSTSPLTLQVLGNAKSVLAVVISVMLFHNPVSAIGMIGYCVSLLGIYLYSDAKSRSSGSNNFSLARVVGTIFFKLTDDKDKDDDEDCERNLRRGYENVKIMNESVNRNTHHIL